MYGGAPVTGVTKAGGVPEFVYEAAKSDIDNRFVGSVLLNEIIATVWLPRTFRFCVLCWAT